MPECLATRPVTRPELTKSQNHFDSDDADCEGLAGRVGKDSDAGPLRMPHCRGSRPSLRFARLVERLYGSGTG
jgi:hypothetical protein